MQEALAKIPMLHNIAGSDPADAGTLERKASAMGQQPEADGTAGPPNETVCSEGHGHLISDWRPSPPRPSGSRFVHRGCRAGRAWPITGSGRCRYS